VLLVAVLSGCFGQHVHVPGPDLVRVDQSNFDTLVVQNPQPVLLDFGATWCGPCQQLAPVVDSLATSYKGKMVVGQVDIDASPKLAQEFRIEGVPTLVVLVNGVEIDRSEGLVGRSDVARMMDNALKYHAARAPQTAAAPSDGSE
jgi:thioredoxin